MTKQSNHKAIRNQKPEFPFKKNPPVAKRQIKNKKMDNAHMENDLNKKILEITMEINEKHPELLKYLEEMPVTIPNEMNPEMTVKQLLSYYESLCSIVTRYKSELPNVSK
jgi:hypothetical protein